jgi:hypothetical protein
MRTPRVVALIASYNERRFIGGCLEHLDEHGIEAYLIDNCSTDETVAIAERFLGRNLIGIEEQPRSGTYDWRDLLRRKEELAGELEADWFIHLDPDEVRLPPRGGGTLAEALAAVDAEGYNAVNFLEFTFIPTREAPDHDHRGFRRTLRTYYPFQPQRVHRLTAWKADGTSTAATPDLVSSGGHRIGLPEVRMYPRDFPMKHYLFVSVAHAIEKYVDRDYDPDEVKSGWHGWRATLTPADVLLPSAAELRLARFEDDLDPRDPRGTHWLESRARAGA